jgi:PAS domain S-box-containing protein
LPAVRYRELLSLHSNDIVLLLDDGFRILDCNERALEAYGRGRDELLTLTFEDVRATEVPVSLKERLAGARGRGEMAFECIHRRRDGGVFPAEISIRVVETGGDSFYHTTVRDITERKQAEEALRESEARLADFFNEAPLGYQSLDEEGRFLEVNPAWLETLGYRREEVIGRWFGDFLAPEYVESFRERFPMFKEHGSIHSEFEMARKDGERRVIAFEGRIGHWPDGAFKQTHCILADVTERRRAEQELQQSQALLKAAMDRSQAGIAIADAPDGRLRYVNQAGLFIRGAAAEDVVEQVDAARYVESWHILHHDGTPYATDEVPLARAVLYGETAEAEFIIRRDDQEDRVVLARAAPIRDAEGVVTAGVVVFHDITERKQAEEEIRRLNAELEQRVVSRTAQLEAVNKELEAFAYSVSHDLRAPLRAIDGFSAAVMEDAAERLDAADLEHLERVRTASRRMARLIDELLGLSRAARQEMQLEEVDLSALAAEVLAELAAAEPARRVEAVVAPGLRAMADAALLRAILANLLGNAWKFTGKHEAARIEVGALDADGERVFFVRDDGAGFDPAHAGHLFGAFQRMHSPGQFEGDGIGLATVQRLVTRHGGRVWADAEVEQGATFYFTLDGALA